MYALKASRRSSSLRARKTGELLPSAGVPAGGGVFGMLGVAGFAAAFAGAPFFAEPFDAAFSADPATGRAVYVGTTYKFSSSAALLSGTMKQFLGGSTIKKKVTGVIRSTFVIDAKGKIEIAQYNVRAKGHVAKLRGELGL